MRLEKALKDVQQMNGSKDIIASLVLALKEYEKGINFDRNLWSLSYRHCTATTPQAGPRDRVCAVVWTREGKG